MGNNYQESKQDSEQMFKEVTKIQCSFSVFSRTLCLL